MKLHRGLLSISDFAAYSGSTRQTMQYYDHIGLLDPIKVGSQGYRYYHPLQGHEVRLIRCLQECGCSLDEIKDILSSSSVDLLQAQIAAKQKLLEQELLRIQREQIFLLRFTQFLSWIDSLPMNDPVLYTLNRTIYFREIPFDGPCELYSDHYYEMLLHYAEFCKQNSQSIQQYPYLFYVSPEEMRSSLRLSKIVCIPDDVYAPASRSFAAPEGQYLAIRCCPDNRNREDHRKDIYGVLFRYMDEHDLVPRDGSVELPFFIPPNLRKGDYRFEVVFILPVASAEGKTEGGKKA